MATRSKKPNSVDTTSLQAAAMILEDRGQGSLLYNSQVIDWLISNGGATALAWHYWGRVPELRYTTRYIANALSVVRLYVGEVDPAGGDPIKLPEDHPASKLMADFAGGQAGQAELLDRLGLHLTVAGDSVIVGPKAGSGGGEQEPFNKWRVYSTEEVYSRNGVVYVQMPGNSKEIRVPASNLPVRIWRQHPVRWYDADSPVKGSFSVLRELVMMDDHVHATGTSRLAGAGFLGIPEELDLPTPEMDIEGTEVDRFVAFLTEVMGLAIKNRESASALVPIILRGPGEFIEKIKHFDFSTEFSAQVPELRMAAIRRLALGMDVPPEILLGSAQSTSWSAWQTDESTLRVHLVPLMQLITSSLTEGWLRPMLEELPLSEKEQEQIPKLVVYFDIGKLKIRQDVSGDAQNLFDRFEIDADTLRMALGYGQDSAPDDKEIARQILFNLIRGGNPELVKYAIQGLRDGFGIKDLPPAAGSDEAVLGGQPGAEGASPLDALLNGPGPGAPESNSTQPPEAEPTSPTPGKRSQDKQTGLPPIPKIGDNSNNANK